MLHVPLFHVVALRPLSLFLQVVISAMSFCQGPENFYLHHLICRENPDPENPVFKSYQKKNLEDKVLLEGTHFYAGPRFFYDRIVNKVEKISLSDQ